MWRLAYSIPMWIIYLIIWIPICLLGLIVIPIAAFFEAYKVRKSLYWDKMIFVWSCPIMWIYGNEEDSLECGKNYYDAGSRFKQIVYWTAIRNPTNNLRFVYPFSIIIDPKKVRFVGSFGNHPDAPYDTNVPHYFFAWHGIFSCIYIMFEVPFTNWLYRLWIGWKIYPSDVISVTEYRKFGSGFALQFKRVK